MAREFARMNDLAQFLLARIAEDENAALKVRNETRERGRYEVAQDGSLPDIAYNNDNLETSFTIAASRVLATCRSYRVIVQACQAAGALSDEDSSEFKLAGLTLCALASAWSDRGDYRTEWATE